MSRPRDSQRRRVYRAERELPEFTGEQFATVEEAQAYLARVLNDPNCRRGMDVLVTFRGRTWSWCRARGSQYEIRLCPAHRNKLVLLHELAHALTSRHVACHGWEFCQNFLELVRVHLGVDRADALCDAFRKHRVRWTPKRSVLRVA